MEARIIRQFGNQLAFHRPHHDKRNVTEFVFNSAISQGKLVEKCALATEAAQRAAEEGLAATDCLGKLSHPHSYSTAPAKDLYNAALFLQYHDKRNLTTSSVRFDKVCNSGLPPYIIV